MWGKSLKKNIFYVLHNTLKCIILSAFSSYTKIVPNVLLSKICYEKWWRCQKFNYVTGSNAIQKHHPLVVFLNRLCIQNINVHIYLCCVHYLRYLHILFKIWIRFAFLLKEEQLPFIFCLLNLNNEIYFYTYH